MSNPFKHVKPVVPPMKVLEPIALRKLVFQHGKVMRATLKRLKQRPPRDLDEQFEKLHEKAFKQIDCLDCGNCCKTTSPIFRDIDVKRISKKMKTSTAEFERNYLNIDGEGDWVLKSAPCCFLQDDNSCGIYDYKPQACGEYPHTDRKRVVQVLDLTLKNTEICPAVAFIGLELIKD